MKCALVSVLLMLGCSAAFAVELCLPTPNEALFQGKPDEFYQYIDRYFGGQHTTTWEGGKYGFVRNPWQSPAGLVYSRFHEGIDIKPVSLDGGGSPQDTVSAIADGTVAYVNDVPGRSNYGRYIVLTHRWDGCDYYSLYAHLAQANVAPGAVVTRGAPIGLMGYSGRGITKERAHLHLEVGLILNTELPLETAPEADTEESEGEGRHGIYHGRNLAGMDPARLFAACRESPRLSIPEFLRQEPCFFCVDFQGPSELDLVLRYPWLRREVPLPSPGGWRVWFDRCGLPLRVASLPVPPQSPRVLVLGDAGGVPLGSLTRGLLRGSGKEGSLTPRGKMLIDWIAYEKGQKLNAKR